jgi:MoaA/NifB/PqqE/SkfB family radical SAM enzyme
MDQTFDFLNISTHIDGDKISWEVGGALGNLPMIKQQVDRFFNIMNSIKVIGKTKDGLNVYNLYNPPQPSKAGMRYLERSVRQMAIKNALPATTNFHITTACQCKCVHCSADPLIDREREMLSTEEMKEAVRGAQRLGSSLVIFTGGDPFCRKDFFELVETVDKEQSICMIFTNGLGLTEENCKRAAEAGLFSLNVSIDSPDPEEHNELRRVPGLYQKALDGAARAREHGIFTGVSTYITSQGLAEGKLERMLELTEKEGFHELTVFDCMPSGNFLKDFSGVLSEDEHRKVIEITDKYNNDPNYKPGVVAQSRVNSPIGAGCFGARAQFYVTCYGDMCPCDFNPVSFGNVRDLGVEGAWFKMTAHPDFRIHHMTCRMQTPEYRERFIDMFEDGATLPVPIEEIEAQWKARGIGPMDYASYPHACANSFSSRVVKEQFERKEEEVKA